MLSNKKILIVGGATGIGLALARRAQEEGGQVILASRSSEKLQAAARSLPIPVQIETVDATSDASVAALFESIGSIDHMAVTIKPSLPSSPFKDNDINLAQQAFDAKFWGQYRLAKAALKTLSTNGSIVLTSGIAAQRSYMGYSAVSAMNAATEALVKALAIEIAPHRINAVSPGFVEAEGDHVQRLAYARNVGANFPLERLGHAEEIAEAYLYLFKNAYANGSCVVVDGGCVC